MKAKNLNDWRGHGGQGIALGVTGAVSLFIGFIMWAVTNAGASACSAALIAALDAGRCNLDDAVHGLGIGGIAVGVILIVAGVVRS
jgi:hypothetical protein